MLVLAVFGPSVVIGVGPSQKVPVTVSVTSPTGPRDTRILGIVKAGKPMEIALSSTKYTVLAVYLVKLPPIWSTCEIGPALVARAPTLGPGVCMAASDGFPSTDGSLLSGESEEPAVPGGNSFILPVELITFVDTCV